MIRKKHIFFFCLAVILGWYLNCLPKTLFDVPYSSVIYAGDGTLLNAQTASDGQWRFPLNNEVPEKFEKALLAFEDKRFYSHLGVDPIGIGRALKENIKQKRIVSGGSTLTMQLMRMCRSNQPRNTGQKLLETILATRAELRYSKKELLLLYSGHAPFGGNVVGLEAASWRYFRKNADNLTWAEASMLAVLPNAPSMIHPGKNRDRLIVKRNRLLKQLLEKETIDSITYRVSLLEKIPKKPLPLPNNAYHLSMRSEVHGIKKTAINGYWQKEANKVVMNHNNRYKKKGIQNAAVMVLDNQTGLPCVYIGNTEGYDHEKMVDMVTASRSSGSILKPLLYGLAIEEGLITPDELLADYPLNIHGFNPKNYNKEYFGAVHASEALSKSLNVPMVALLRKYGVGKFLANLKKLGFSTLTRSSDDYGLSLILGGAEVKLEDLVRVYSRLAVQLNNYEKESERRKAQSTEKEKILSSGSIFWVFEAMKQVVRPDENGFWESFSSSEPIAWKTGTSYGHRDAWAVGVNKRYTVGVWVGNSDGEGRPEIVGSSAAGSLMFDIWNILPKENKGFTIPHDDLREYNICKKSGQIATSRCMESETRLYPKATKWARPCAYHQQVFVDKTRSYRIYLDCEEEVIDTTWFVLPPSMAYYYKRNHSDYSEIPKENSLCGKSDKKKTMDILYPTEGETIYMPKGLNGEKMELVIKAVHIEEGAEIYWHMDESYVGKTADFHFLKTQSGIGEHQLTLLDQAGNRIMRTYKVVGDKKSM